MEHSEKFDHVIIQNNILIAPPPLDIYNPDLLKQFFISLTAVQGLPCLTDSITGKSKKGKEIMEEIKKLSASLRVTLGVKPGDVVCVSSENRMEIFSVIAAVWSLGAVVATVDYLFTTNEFMPILTTIEPKIIICNQQVEHQIQPIKSELPTLEKIILFNGDSDSDLTFSDLIAGSPAEENEEFSWAIPVPLDSVGVLLCTSCTTGPAKCVELTYRSIQLGVTGVIHEHDKHHRLVFASLLPLYHGYGFLTLLESIIRGCNFIIFPTLEFHPFLQAIEKYKIESIATAPPVLVLFAKHPLVTTVSLSSIEDIRIGGAPTSAKLIEEALRRLKEGTQIWQTYGITEGSMATAASKPGSTDPASVGNIVRGIKCKIIDIESGNLLGPGEEGELCVHGDLVMKGYKNNKAATDQIIDKDGWLHTGDVCCYNESGQLYIKDRIIELIKFNGCQVSPAELESLILQHPKVTDAAVWGRPDESAGQLPMAFVVSKEQVTAEEILNFVADRVAPHKRLRGGVVFVDVIPKSPYGKILRKNLESIFGSLQNLPQVES